MSENKALSNPNENFTPSFFNSPLEIQTGILQKLDLSSLRLLILACSSSPTHIVLLREWLTVLNFPDEMNQLLLKLGFQNEPQDPLWYLKKKIIFRAAALNPNFFEDTILSLTLNNTTFTSHNFLYSRWSSPSYTQETLGKDAELALRLKKQHMDVVFRLARLFSAEFYENDKMILLENYIWPTMTKNWNIDKEAFNIFKIMVATLTEKNKIYFLIKFIKAKINLFEIIFRDNYTPFLSFEEKSILAIISGLNKSSLLSLFKKYMEINRNYYFTKFTWQLIELIASHSPDELTRIFIIDFISKGLKHFKKNYDTPPQSHEISPYDTPLHNSGSRKLILTCIFSCTHFINFKELLRFLEDNLGTFLSPYDIAYFCSESQNFSEKLAKFPNMANLEFLKKSIDPLILNPKLKWFAYSWIIIALQKSEKQLNANELKNFNETLIEFLLYDFNIDATHTHKLKKHCIKALKNHLSTDEFKIFTKERLLPNALRLPSQDSWVTEIILTYLPKEEILKYAESKSDFFMSLPSWAMLNFFLKILKRIDQNQKNNVFLLEFSKRLIVSNLTKEQKIKPEIVEQLFSDIQKINANFLDDRIDWLKNIQKTGLWFRDEIWKYLTQSIINSTGTDDLYWEMIKNYSLKCQNEYSHASIFFETLFKKLSTNRAATAFKDLSTVGISFRDKSIRSLKWFMLLKCKKEKIDLSGRQISDEHKMIIRDISQFSFYDNSSFTDIQTLKEYIKLLNAEEVLHFFLKLINSLPYIKSPLSFKICFDFFTDPHTSFTEKHLQKINFALNRCYLQELSDNNLQSEQLIFSDHLIKWDQVPYLIKLDPYNDPEIAKDLVEGIISGILFLNNSVCFPEKTYRVKYSELGKDLILELPKDAANMLETYIDACQSETPINYPKLLEHLISIAKNVAKKERDPSIDRFYTIIKKIKKPSIDKTTGNAASAAMAPPSLKI